MGQDLAPSCQRGARHPCSEGCLVLAEPPGLPGFAASCSGDRAGMSVERGLEAPGVAEKKIVEIVRFGDLLQIWWEMSPCPWG